MMPTITRPTILSHTSATLIDNILINQKENENYDSYVLTDNTSDHLPCACVLYDAKASKRDTKTLVCRDTKRSNINRLNEEICNFSWSTITETNDHIDKKTETFITKLNEHINHFLPYRTRRISYKKLRKEPWITPALMKSIHKGKTLYKQQLQGNPTMHIEYKEYNTILNKVKRHAKKQYYIDRCTEFKSNMKQLWRTINRIVGKTNDKSNVISELLVHNKTLTHPVEISNQFCTYFSNVGKNFANKIPKSKKTIEEYLCMIRMNKDSVFFYPTTRQEIQKIIQKLPNKKSSGHDNIDNVLLKEISEGIIEALEQLFNESLKNGIFPDIFKLAEVVPLHKGKETNLQNNYHPISLLCTLSKVLEKIVYKRLYTFLNNSGQITRSQYRFRANHGCDHAIGELISEIVKNLQLHQPTVCLYLDLSKAFDTLLHHVILRKLEQYGVRGTCLEWMNSYLNNRRMRVKCNNEDTTTTRSQVQPVLFGTPQGSCLGPLLFLVFCNDLDLQLQYLSSLQFADDTTLYISHQNRNYIQFCIEQDMIHLKDWFRANKLTLNIDKTVAMIFDPKRMNHNTKRINNNHSAIRISIEDVAVPIVPHTKFLGIWIDDNLTWNIHLQKLETRLKTKICMLQRGKNILTVHAKKILYYAQVHSLLAYGLIIWGNMLNRTRQTRLQKIQNKAVQLIAPHKNLRAIYKDHRILNIAQLIQLENIKMWHKYHNNQLPEKLQHNMSTDHRRKSTHKIHNYNTRNKGIPNLPQVTNSCYKNSFLSDGLRDYQLTPQSVKECKNMTQCIKLTKNLLLAN